VRTTLRFSRAAAVLVGVFVGCAASGPNDALDGTSHDVRGDAGTTQVGAYAYVARRALVAVGLADARGVSEDETHRAIDRVALEATSCFKRAATLTRGAARIVLPIDAGGIAGAPQTEFSPPSAALQGMLCVLAPLRLSTFTPDKTTGARSITIEAAWGSDLTP
jgi:hypothetical protein